MFTGIIEEIGVVQAIAKKANLITLTIKADKVIRGAQIGDSICVEGVCLTVARKNGKNLTFEVMKESLDVSTLKYLSRGEQVNLESSLRANGKFGGHFVTGHVDSLETIKRIVKLPNYIEFEITLAKKLRRFVVAKGSITIDGVSLTVGRVGVANFSVYLIPHTLKITTLGGKKAGDKVNIETDVLAKYVLSNRK